MTMIIPPRREFENNREYAYRVLRSNIMTVHLLPGAALSESELSEQLEMSRTPVHEALMILKSEWLVDILPQRGSLVSRIRIDYVKEGVSMRKMLETSIIQELAGRLNSEQLQRFADNLGQQMAVIKKNDKDTLDQEFFELDNEFHKLLYVTNHFHRTWTAMHTVTSHYDRVRYLDAVTNMMDWRRIMDQHVEFYHYLMIGIPADVNIWEEYDKHLGQFRTGFRRLLEAYPEYFI